MSTREELPNEPKNVFRAGRGDSPSLRTVELREPCRTRPNGANCKVVTTQADMLPKCPRACRTPSMCIGSAGACTTPEHKQPRQRSGESPWSAFRCNWGACACSWLQLGAHEMQICAVRQAHAPSAHHHWFPSTHSWSARGFQAFAAPPFNMVVLQSYLPAPAAAELRSAIRAIRQTQDHVCHPETHDWACLEACSQQYSARTSRPNLTCSKVSHTGSTNKVVCISARTHGSARFAVRPYAATVSRPDRL